MRGPIQKGGRKALPEGARLERALRFRLAAFFLVGGGVLERIFRGRTGWQGMDGLDGLAVLSVAAGLVAWILSKGMERRAKREERLEEETETQGDDRKDRRKAGDPW